MEPESGSVRVETQVGLTAKLCSFHLPHGASTEQVGLPAHGGVGGSGAWSAGLQGGAFVFWSVLEADSPVGFRSGGQCAVLGTAFLFGVKVRIKLECCYNDEGSANCHTRKH